MTSHQIRNETIHIMDRLTELRVIGSHAMHNLNKYFLKFSFPIFGRPIQRVSILRNDNHIEASLEHALTLLPDLTAINICTDLVNHDYDDGPEQVFTSPFMNNFMPTDDIWILRDNSDEDERRLGRIRTLAEIQDMAEDQMGIDYSSVYRERIYCSGLSKAQVKVVMTIPFRSDNLDKTVRDFPLQQNLLNID